jgi:hypothetical protein
MGLRDPLTMNLLAELFRLSGRSADLISRWENMPAVIGCWAYQLLKDGVYDPILKGIQLLSFHSYVHFFLDTYCFPC